MPFRLCCDALRIPVDAVRRAMLENPQGLLENLRAIQKGGDVTPLKYPSSAGRSAQTVYDSQDRLLRLSAADTQIAGVRLDFLCAKASTRQNASERLKALCQVELGFELPLDWNGGVQIKGCVEKGDEIEWAEDVPAEFYGVYAQHESGLHQWLADYPTSAEAHAIARRLVLIDAHSQPDVAERTAKLARVSEELVRVDPDANEDDRIAAKEDRKLAEGVAMMTERGHAIPAELAQQRNVLRQRFR